MTTTVLNDLSNVNLKFVFTMKRQKYITIFMWLLLLKYIVSKFKHKVFSRNFMLIAIMLLTILNAHKYLRQINFKYYAGKRYKPYLLIICKSLNKLLIRSSNNVLIENYFGIKKWASLLCLKYFETINNKFKRKQRRLHTSGKVSIVFGNQSVTEFVNAKIHRELLTEIVKGSSTKCKFVINDDSKVSTTGLWPYVPPPDATDGIISSENNQC